MRIEEILQKNLGDKLKFNVLLKDYSSLKVGGVADFFIEAESVSEIIKAVTIAHELDMPYRVIGGGYNIVPSDLGFPGLIILNTTKNTIFSSESSSVIADSGVNLGKLINLAAGRDLGGLEFLAGVPGTIGGSVYGNAGAKNQSIGDFVKSVTILNFNNEDITVEKHDQKWMNFSYRSSRFKEANSEKDRPVILTVTLQLVQRRKDEILRLIRENLNRKRKTQPISDDSAGSFFKNTGSSEDNAAGYLLEKSGAKKIKVGGAGFSKKHANFLINVKNASANDVRSAAEKAKELVQKKFNISLDEEIEYIGKW